MIICLGEQNDYQEITILPSLVGSLHSTRTFRIHAADPHLPLPTLYIYIYIYIRRSLNKNPDFFRMATFIDSTHMKL